MNNFLKKIWRNVVPEKLRGKLSYIRNLINLKYIIFNPTYAEDGLISEHVTTFWSDENFMRSYAKGKESGALDKHPGEIYFRAYIACWAAKQAQNLEGDFVECGVGYG
jgi:hypothetical protein